ncbi:MAG: metalloregulator ArsR/SmtB family transcription factor [Bacilli bacterium]|nr:metalloregulator ArsR/SmtB family transcription factor [Bacilli bacterium]
MKDILNNMENEDFLFDVADFFKVFGDSTRIKILCALYDKEMCVLDLANAINLSQSATSHQLSLLRINRLVKYRREGTTLYYSLDDEHIMKIIAMAIEHLKEK